MVGQVGFEPTVFLMSRFYRPLRSPATHTDPYWWNRLGSNQRLPGFNWTLCLLGYGSMAEGAELESDAQLDTIRLAGGPWASQVHPPYW